MVDYGLLPPEINSGRIYAGPGSGPMLAAAAAWSGLAGDLQAAASGHRSVITELTGGLWLGPASVALLSAVTPFISWLDSGAVDADQAASQAFAAAAAYEAAFAATVPPPVIAANRALLAVLVATNFFGQNTPAIAAAETLYAEFWAQDAGAMYTYAGNSAAATQLAELPEPAEVVDPGGMADQAIAAFKAQNQVLQTSVGNVLAQINPRVTTVLQTLSAPLNGTAIDQWLVANTPLDDIIPLYSKYLSPYVAALASVFSSGQGFGQSSSGLVAMTNLLNGLAPATQAVQGAAQAAGAAAANAGANLGGSIGGVAAGLGKAIPLGGLSVPAGWTTSATSGAPGTTNVAVATLTNGTTAPTVANSAAGGVPAAPPFGQFVNSGKGRKLPSYGFRLTFMTKPPAAG
jgi:PPE-repeat protein